MVIWFIRTTILSLSYKITNVMDAKITMSFDADVIDEAKKFSERHNISLSRLTEFLLRKSMGAKYYSLDDLPVADWVNMLSEGEVEYQKSAPSSKSLKAEYYNSKKKK